LAIWHSARLIQLELWQAISDLRRASRACPPPPQRAGERGAACGLSPRWIVTAKILPRMVIFTRRVEGWNRVMGALISGTLAAGILISCPIKGDVKCKFFSLPSRETWRLCSWGSLAALEEAKVAVRRGEARTATFSVVAGKPAEQEVHPALQPELPQIQATRLTLHGGGDDDACRGVGRAARRRAGRGVGPSARRAVGRHALYGASPAPPAWLEPKSWPAQPAPTKSVKMTLMRITVPLKARASDVSCFAP
jgi:hypothetical protein